MEGTWENRIVSQNTLLGCFDIAEKATTTLSTISDVTELVFDTDGDGGVDAIIFDDTTKEEISYDTLREAIQESGMSDLQTKLFLKQVDVVEKLHDGGNVIAAKATLTALQKQIERLDCEDERMKWGKRACVDSEYIVDMGAIINILLEQLENPVEEKKDDLKEKAQKLKDKLKRVFNH